MALLTLGSNATTSLAALSFTRNPPSVADVATFNANVKNDLTIGGKIGAIVPGAFRNGLLTIPNRGTLQIMPGDFIAYDATTGWPILLSALAIASGPWSHS